MIVTIRCKDFQSGKEENRYFKEIIKNIDLKFNKNVLSLGDWPLVIKIESDAKSNFYFLKFTKVSEPSETPEKTMQNIICYIKKDLNLKVYNIERELL